MFFVSLCSFHSIQRQWLKTLIQVNPLQIRMKIYYDDEVWPMIYLKREDTTYLNCISLSPNTWITSKTKWCIEASLLSAVLSHNECVSEYKTSKPQLLLCHSKTNQKMNAFLSTKRNYCAFSRRYNRQFKMLFNSLKISINIKAIMAWHSWLM